MQRRTMQQQQHFMPTMIANPMSLMAHPSAMASMMVRRGPMIQSCNAWSGPGGAIYTPVMAQTPAEKLQESPPQQAGGPASISGQVAITMTAEQREAQQLRLTNPAFRIAGQKLCNSTKYFGAWWSWRRGWQTTLAKRMKLLAIQWIHPRIWNAMRVNRLKTETNVDAACYGLFGALPDMEISDLSLTYKRELWDMLLDNHEGIMLEQPGRLSGLAGDLSNVVEWALGLGFPKGFIPSLEQLERAEKKKRHDKKRANRGKKTHRGKKQTKTTSETDTESGNSKKEKESDATSDEDTDDSLHKGKEKTKSKVRKVEPKQNFDVQGLPILAAATHRLGHRMQMPPGPGTASSVAQTPRGDGNGKAGVVAGAEVKGQGASASSPCSSGALAPTMAPSQQQDLSLLLSELARSSQSFCAAEVEAFDID